METYVVRLNSQRPTLKQRAISALFFGGFYFILMFGWRFFWPSPAERYFGLLSIVAETGLISLLYGLGMAFWPPKRPGCKILVDDESITGITEYDGWMKWLAFRRTVSKGKIRTIWEIKGRLGSTGGTGLSERSRLGARMWGFVYLPRSLPEYESLRALAESWRSHEGIG
jgi:hypothetical protein